MTGITENSEAHRLTLALVDAFLEFLEELFFYLFGFFSFLIFDFLSNCIQNFDSKKYSSKNWFPLNHKNTSYS